MSPDFRIFPYIEEHYVVNLRCLVFAISSNLLMFNYVVVFFVVVFCFPIKTPIFPGSSLPLQKFLTLLGYSPQ